MKDEMQEEEIIIPTPSEAAKIEETLEGLFYKDAEDWPDYLRDLSNPVPPITPEADERIRTAVFAAIDAELEREAAGRNKRFITRVRWATLAATVILVLSPVLFFLTRGDPGDAFAFRVLKSKGDVALVDKFRPGNRLKLTSNAMVLLGRETTRIEFRGPGILRFLESDDDKTTILEAPLGVLYYSHSGNTKDRFFVRGRSLLIDPTGTAFRFEVNLEGEFLVVSEGRVRVRSRTEVRDVRAGKKLEFLRGRDKLPAVLPASTEDLRELKRRQSGEIYETNGVDRLEKERTQTLPGPRFKNLAAIQKRFGSLQEIQLSGGGSLRGYVLMEGNRLVIYTVDGILRLDRSRVTNFKNIDVPVSENTQLNPDDRAGIDEEPE